MAKELESIYNQTVNNNIAKFQSERILFDPKLEGSINQLRKAMIDTFEPNKLKSQTKYTAIVLAQLPSIKVEDKTSVRVLARIPELHALLPLPESPRDFARMMSYPAFTSEDDVLKDPLTHTALDSIPAGSEVEVSFGDSANFSAPKLIRIISLLTPSPAGTDNPDNPHDDPDVSKAANDGEGPRAPTSAGWGAPELDPAPSAEEKAKAAAKAKREAASTPKEKPHPTVAEITTHEIPEVLASWITKEKRFGSSKRRRNIDLIIIHDSCTSTAEGMVRVLNNRGLGTHLSISANGNVKQYVSIDRQTWHAGNWNPRSIGIDMAVRCQWTKTSYKPGMKKAPSMPKKSDGLRDPKNQRVAFFPFGWGKQLVIPNAIAMKAAYNTVKAIRKAKPNIPLKFPGVRSGGMYFGKAPANSTGIVAHGQLAAKSDGRVTVYYLWLRMVKGLSHAAAYNRVLDNMNQLAAKWVSTGKYPSRTIPSGPILLGLASTGPKPGHGVFL